MRDLDVEGKGKLWTDWRFFVWLSGRELGFFLGFDEFFFSHTVHVLDSNILVVVSIGGSGFVVDMTFGVPSTYGWSLEGID